MINKVIVENLMSWKWRHEIEYKDWITLFNWTFWVWKSSILVDSLDLAFSNNARNANSEMITKGEESGLVEVFFTMENIEYKIYWYYKPKSKKKKIVKGIEKEVSTSAKTIWLTYQKIGDEYEEINKTPEQILWISYEIAKKTFIIWQFDLDNFSSAWPSEKYEMIAESFWIDKLFEIWDKTKEKIKEKIIEKDLLSKNLDWVNTTQFDLLEDKQKTLQVLHEKILNYQIKETEINNNKELFNNKKYELNSLTNYFNSNILNKTIIEEVSKINILEIESNIQKIKNVLEKQDITKIEKLEESLKNQQDQKTHLKINFDNVYSKEKELSEAKINILKNDILAISQTFQALIIENPKRFTKDMRKKLSLIDLKQPMSIIENTKQIIEKFNIEKNNFIIKKSTLENEKINNQNVINNIKNLNWTSTCPTCYKSLSDLDIITIETQFKKIIEELDKKLKTINSSLLKKEEEIKIQNEIIKEQETIIFDKNELEKLIEKEKIWNSWKEKQIEYKTLITELEKRLNIISTKYEKDLEEVIKTINNSEKEINQLKNSNKYYEIKNQLDLLITKLYTINWVNYDLNWLKVLEQSKKEVISLNNEKIKTVLDKYQLNENANIENELNILNELIIKENQSLENLKNLKNEKNEEYLNLKNEYDKLIYLKKEYDKIKWQLFIINSKLDKLEKISFIFWKKWEPKNIIEKIIIPQLEDKTNNILSEITSWKYMVSFSLSSLTWDWKESKKNIFDIIVYQNWIPLAYQNLSWWEKTNVNFSIRLWITECLNDLLWKKINDFLILDETFNSVDEQEGWENVINAINEIDNSWRFKQIFIITHVTYIQEKLQDLSNVINIEKRGKYSKII